MFASECRTTAAMPASREKTSARSPRKPSGPGDSGVNSLDPVAVRGPYSAAFAGLENRPINFGLGVWIPDSLATRGFRDDTPCGRRAWTAPHQMISVSKSLAPLLCPGQRLKA
jgi:hypothetical protein